MCNSTEEYVVWLLDIQYQHYLNLNKDATQFAYYQGLLEMAGCIVSDAYKSNTYIFRDANGHHSIHKE